MAKRYYELDVLDRMAAHAAAYKIIRYTEESLSSLTPESQVTILDLINDGIRALELRASEAVVAAQEQDEVDIEPAELVDEPEPEPMPEPIDDIPAGTGG